MAKDQNGRGNRDRYGDNDDVRDALSSDDGSDDRDEPMPDTGASSRGDALPRPDLDEFQDDRLRRIE
ncbi:MAG TPA: hypothetical protein VE869_03170 [Gemmatimonas sp.]|nr:hypothetical protein [Gemmatimonas sp.]